jgi:hypothetical protein
MEEYPIHAFRLEAFAGVLNEFIIYKTGIVISVRIIELTIKAVHRLWVSPLKLCALEKEVHWLENKIKFNIRKL